jgi:hypothetical protein
MSHTKEARVLETEMRPSRRQGRPGSKLSVTDPASCSMYCFLWGTTSSRRLHWSTGWPNQRYKCSGKTVTGRTRTGRGLPIKWKGVMGSSQEFSTSLLSGPGGKRRKGRLDDESRNAFYAAAAALIPADFMDKRMGRSLERLTNIPRKMLPKVAAIKKVGSAEGAGCKQAMPLWMQCGWTVWTRRTCGTSTSVEKRAMTKSSSCIWTCSLGSRACGRGHIPITAGWLAAASCSP